MERRSSVSASASSGTEFVGRRAELRRVDELIRRAAARAPTMVLIEGPSGIGKSAFVRALIERLEPDTALARVRGAEMERRLDFGVLAQLYRHAVEVGMPRLPERVLGELRPDPLDVGAQVLKALRASAVPRLSVFVIDDAHWADPASLQSIAFAFRRLRDSPILAVIAHRPDPEVMEEFTRLVDDGRASVIRLGPLSPADVGELVRRRTGVRVSPAAARRLHQHTAGRPLDVLALADELPAEVLTAGIGDLPAPRSFASVVLARVAACSPAAEAVAIAVSVLGRPAEPATIAAMLERDDVGAAIDEAIERGLVHTSVTAGRRTVDVEHPLVRAAILDDLAPSRLAEAHRRAAAVSADPDRALLHRLRGVTGVERTLGEEAMARADERLASGWTLVGVELLLAAADVLGPGPRRRQAILTAALRLATDGELTAARQLLTVVPSQAGGALGELAAGVLALNGGDVAGARGHLERAYDRADADGDDSIAARAAAELAAMANHSVDAAGALRWARRALGRTPSPDVDVGPSMSTIAWACSQLGDLAAGAEEIATWSARSGEGDESADSMLSRGLIALWEGDHESASDLLRRVANTSIGQASLMTVAHATHSFADADYRIGNWDRSLRTASALAESLHDSGHPLTAPMAHGVAAFVLAARGAADEARHHLELGYRARQAADVPAGWLWLEVGSARLALAADEPDRAIHHFDKIAAFLGDQPILDVVQPWRADNAVALVAVGEHERARQQLAALAREASTSPHARAGVARAEAALGLALGDQAGAASAFERALADDAALTGAYERGRLELAAGAFERRRGQRRRATELLNTACDRFVALAAAPAVLVAQSELRRCGSERRTRTTDLTPAEHTVAGLVAQGRTNREIAAELVVSVKTVESHLARVFTKLGIRSRTELARDWVHHS